MENTSYSTRQIKTFWQNQSKAGIKGLAMLAWCIEQSGPTKKNTDPLQHFYGSAVISGNDAAAALIKKIHRHVTTGYALVEDKGKNPHASGFKVNRKDGAEFTDAMQTLNKIVAAGELGLNNRERLLKALGIESTTAEFVADKYAATVAKKLLAEDAGIDTFINALKAAYKKAKAAE